MRIMKKLIVILLLLLGLFNAKSQILSDTTVEYRAIKSFLIEKKQWANYKPALIAYGCIIDSLSEKPCGIYTFKQMSSSASVYICFKNKNGQIKIIDDYYIVNILEELNRFFSENLRCLSHIDAINYTIEILQIVKQMER